MHGPIVVGTDGSDTADKAVAAPIDLARSFDQPLHVVSAFRPVPLPRDLPAEFVGTIRGSSGVEAILDDVMSRARVAGVSATAHAEPGSAADAVLSVAHRVDAKVIVVGNKGFGSKSRYVVGNVPSKVAHHSTGSTFVVQTARRAPRDSASGSATSIRPLVMVMRPQPCSSQIPRLAVYRVTPAISAMSFCV